MKFTTERLKEIIQEELDKIQQESKFDNPQFKKRMEVIKGMLEKNSSVTMYKISLEDIEDGTYLRAFDSWSGGLMGAARRNKHDALVQLLQKLRYDVFGGEGVEMK